MGATSARSSSSEHHEDAAQNEDHGPGHVPVGGVAQIEKHGGVALDHALEAAFAPGSRGWSRVADGFRGVGTGVQDHLQAGGGPVRGDVGVAQSLEPLVALEVEVGEEDGVGPGGEGALEGLEAARPEPRAARSACLGGRRRRSASALSGQLTPTRARAAMDGDCIPDRPSPRGRPRPAAAGSRTGR